MGVGELGPFPGGWSAWSPWGRCSVTCAIGNKERFRSCTEPPPACGGTCPGSNRQIQSCVLQDICPTHGSWSVWASWGSCSSSCREEGSSHTPRQRRNRTCNNPTPSFDPPGDPCPGADVDIGLCDFLPFCPVAGNWGSWAESAPCSVSCGIGTFTKAGPVTLPHQVRWPRLDTACSTWAWQLSSLNPRSAQRRGTWDVVCVAGELDGVWTNWGQWSLCARTGWNITCTQFVGQQRRTRHCRGRSHGGEPCQGSIIEVRTCYDSDNCWYGKGVWSDWSDWGLCHPPCGEGSSRSRSRVCEPVYPKYPEPPERDACSSPSLIPIQCCSSIGNRSPQNPRVCSNDLPETMSFSLSVFLSMPVLLSHSLSLFLSP
ncbi:properdin-like [Chiloscyllium punctatum]|uniref:properdin-like n=1 Tax=Chiloscyllium punctatum TaxID=137246 RepID=UPI003B63C391